MASLPPEMFNEDTVQLLRSYDTVDLLIGIPSFQNANTIGHVVRAVEAGLRKYFPNRRSLIVVSDGDSTDGTRRAALAATTEGDEEVLLLDPKAEVPDKLAFTYTGLSGKGSAFRAIFTVAEALGASACAVFDADLRSVSPEWVDRLIGPVLDHGRDLVAPMYERHKFDGTITNSIAFPLTAALYGQRLRQPIGGDFGFSGRLASHWARKRIWHTDVARFGVDIWMTTVALCEDFSVCQAILGAKLHDAKDPGRDLGPMFRQVIGSLFALAGRYADHWLAVDGIRPVRTFGFQAETSTEEIKVNPDRLLWRFVDGYVTYQDVWHDVLGRDNLTGVREAIHQASERPGGFRLPIELWAHICYDYLLAYNAQVVDHGELTNSLIPLYFARTATFINESRNDSAEEAEERIASYAEVFRRAKPYLVRRFLESGRARRLADQRVSGDERREGDDTSEFMAIRSP
ncbi:MAG TPA: glycosyl transferase family 2 [Actinomycetes bacterium]|nr:glycosyl transferase family 2 [Actinomycetes bacterium]